MRGRSSSETVATYLGTCLWHAADESRCGIQTAASLDSSSHLKHRSVVSSKIKTRKKIIAAQIAVAVFFCGIISMCTVSQTAARNFTFHYAFIVRNISPGQQIRI